MDRTRNPNPSVRHNIDNRIRGPGKAIPPIGAQIHFMMSIRYIERLRQLAWARAKTFLVIEFAPFFHQLNPADRFDRANQNKTVHFAFDEHI